MDNIMYTGIYTNGGIKLHPRKFINLKEAQEVLIIPLGKNKNRAAGILHEYANSTLREKEEGAFLNAMVEKHNL